MCFVSFDKKYLLFLLLHRDTDAIDVMPMYSELAKDSDFAITHTANNPDDEAPGTSRGRTRVS